MNRAASRGFTRQSRPFQPHGSFDGMPAKDFFGNGNFHAWAYRNPADLAPRVSNTERESEGARSERAREKKSIMAATAATTRRWSIAAHPLSLGGGGDSSAHAHLPLTQRPLDLFFVFYFITHVPTSLLVDAQCVLPPGNFPQAARDALAYHLETFKDPLMGTCPAWLRSIIWCELALQVPFFILATYAFCARKNWIRMVSHETDKKHSPNGYRTRALSCAFLPAFLPLCVCVCSKTTLID